MLLVTGASGFLGSTVVRLALEKGLEVRAMVRSGTSLDLLQGFPLPPSSIVFGDMADPPSLAKAVEGVGAVVHCAATTSEMAPDFALSRTVNVLGVRHLLEECRMAGVRRFIQISSQSAHPENPSVYGRTKREADEVLRGSSDWIDWTILKPSIIYGPHRRGVFYKMVRAYSRLPVVPVFGSGNEEMRPIHVDDVAHAILACLENPRTVHQAYDLGGADSLRFNDFVTAVLEALGQRKIRVHVPIWLLLAGSTVLSWIFRNPPVTPDNVRGIETVRPVDISAAQKDFGFAPRFFAQGLKEVVALLGDTRKESECKRNA